jgi:hypothetical protein
MIPTLAICVAYTSNFHGEELDELVSDYQNDLSAYLSEEKQGTKL